MRPVIANHVIYTRVVGEEFAAVITRVILTRTADIVVAVSRGPHTLTSAAMAPSTSVDEADFDVYLAVHVHDADEAVTTYLGPVVYNASGSANNTWRWPPAVVGA